MEQKIILIFCTFIIVTLEFSETLQTEIALQSKELSCLKKTGLSHTHVQMESHLFPQINQLSKLCMDVLGVMRNVPACHFIINYTGHL